MPGPDTAPPMRRRLAAMLYEGVLLFGIVMIAGLGFSIATDQTHALQGQTGLRIFLFCVLAAYFSYFWTHGGQTLAMKTWRIRLERQDGALVGLGKALCRYLLAWLWFVPALAGAQWAGWTSTAQLSAVIALGMALYAGISLLVPGRQFLHDWLCGTRLRPWAAKALPPGAAAAHPGSA